MTHQAITAVRAPWHSVLASLRSLPMRSFVVGVTLLLAACGGEDGTAEDRALPCHEVWADGVDVDTAIESWDRTGCTDDASALTFIGSTSQDCTDGRTLYWNDEGWGYSGDIWHRHVTDSKVAPEDERAACRS